MPSPQVSTPSNHRSSSISSLSEERASSVKRYGILSQTVSSGTQIRWILPARIRSRKHNDVVFVGTTSIQLRECRSDGTLLDATAKLHLGTQILAARVVSAKIEKVPTIDAVLRQEWDEEQFLIKGKPCLDEQPPQILVLCTATNELVYLYALQTRKSAVRFVYAKHTIVPGMSMLSKWGRHMAIDSESKLLAVATSDVLTVISLKDVDDLKAAIDTTDPRRPKSFEPHKEQRSLHVDGTILRMEFLRHPDEDHDKTFLFIIVAKEAQSKILLYRWDSQEALIFMEPLKCSGRTLPVTDSCPLMLIPSSRPLSFYMVTEFEMVFYENILSTTAKRLATPLNSDIVATGSHLWAQWAKPVRHDQYEKDKEEILLIREDGMTRFFSRTHNPPSDAVIAIVPGNLNISVDTAVCMLPGPRVRGGDLLILGGLGTDGGVFWFPPRDFPQILQFIPNLSPLHSMLPLSTQRQNRQEIPHRQRMFSISGDLQGTRVNELRFGFEAQSLATIPIDDCPTIDLLWAVEQESSSHLFFVASTLDRTIVISQSLMQSEDMHLLEDQTCCALILGEQTLAIEKLRSGTIVQITTSGIYVVSEFVIGGSAHHIHHIQRCTGADFDPVSGMFAVACTDADTAYVAVGMIQESASKPNIVIAPKTLDTNRPFSMRLTKVFDYHILALGFFDGSVQLHTVDASGEIHLRTTMEPSTGRGTGVSAIDILHVVGQPSALVLIGTLDGNLTLNTLHLHTDEERPSFSIDFCASYSMGLSRVSVTRDIHDEGEGNKSSFISSDERLAKVSLLGHESPLSFSFDEIWITDRANPATPQPTIRAITRVPQLNTDVDSEWSRSVLFAAPDQILSTNLIQQRQTIPLLFGRCGQARQMAYSVFLDKILVAAESTFDQDGKLKLQPALHLISPTVTNSLDQTASPIHFGNENDKVKALLNWSPSDGRTHYNLVIIALSDGHDSRVGHLSTKKLSEATEGTINFKTIMTLPHTEVHAICEIGTSSLIIAAGNQLILLKLEVEAKKWLQQTRYELPSAAFSLSVRGTYIYAATKRHSMMVFKLDDQQLKMVFTDRSADNVRHVLPFGSDGRHVLVSALNGTETVIYGYMQGSSIGDNPSPSFEAQIPLPIDHLIPIKTDWTNGGQHGFQASTLDGTIYHLKTLSFDEYKLLRFIEKMARMDITKPSRRPMALLTRRMAETWATALEAAGNRTFDPRNMHVNGDVIERLVEERPHGLRDLFEPTVKSEDAMVVDSQNDRRARFDSLAARVVGHNADQFAAVHAWARRLLRSSFT